MWLGGAARSAAVLAGVVRSGDTEAGRSAAAGHGCSNPGHSRLVVLGLIAEEPRHGYDIIKALEARFQGAYSPSPGSDLSVLQMLGAADLVRLPNQRQQSALFYYRGQGGERYLDEYGGRTCRAMNAQIDRRL